MQAVGYYTQHTPPMPDNMRIIDYVQAQVDLSSPSAAASQPSTVAPDLSLQSQSSMGLAARPSASDASMPTNASLLLERFGFSRAKQFQW